MENLPSDKNDAGVEVSFNAKKPFLKEDYPLREGVP